MTEWHLKKSLSVDLLTRRPCVSTHALEVIAITAKRVTFIHAVTMQRAVDEAEYVLQVLYRMRDEIAENEELYDANASQRIDDAIARVEDVLRQVQLTTCSVEQNSKAA